MTLMCRKCGLDPYECKCQQVPSKINEDSGGTREQFNQLEKERAVLLWFASEMLSQLVLGMAANDLLNWIEVYKQVQEKKANHQ